MQHKKVQRVLNDNFKKQDSIHDHIQTQYPIFISNTIKMVKLIIQSLFISYITAIIWTILTSYGIKFDLPEED